MHCFCSILCMVRCYVSVLQVVSGVIEEEEQLKGGTEMDWCKALMWIATICVFVAMVGEYFLPQIVVVALAFVGTAIMVAIVAYLMDGE